MIAQEIPREQWADFLERFSTQHRGWLVSVELSVPSGARLDAIDVPLERIQLAGSDGEESIRLALGGEAAAHERLPNPARLRIERTLGGADTELSIESERGAGLIVRIHSPMLPEDVDGVP
jgi:hypothetical protein